MPAVTKITGVNNTLAFSIIQEFWGSWSGMTLGIEIQAKLSDDVRLWHCLGGIFIFGSIRPG